MNSIIIIGRLTRDPEQRLTQSGTTVVNMVVAVDRPVKEGEEKIADFIRVTAFGKQAESCHRYLGKGRLVAVRGRLNVGNYTGRDGEKRFSAEVLADQVKFLDSAQKTAPRAAEGRTEASVHGTQLTYDDIPDAFAASDDYIPF